jgi:hypothetical protein
MQERGSWPIHLRQAALESSRFGRNWRWMLASLGVGGGLGLVAGLLRQGREPAHLALAEAVAMLRAAVLVFVVAWLVVVAVRFGRRLRS